MTGPRAPRGTRPASPGRGRAETPAPALRAGGAIATRFAAAPGSEPRRELGVDPRRLDLGDAGPALAEEVVACAGAWLGRRDRFGLALALLTTQVAARQGSTRVPLDRAGLRDLVASMLVAGDREVDAAVDDLLRVAGDQSALGGRLVGRGGETRPLVVDDGCLYQHRLWWLETRLAARLADRIATPPASAPVAAAIAAVTARPGKLVLTAQQVAAVRTALGGHLGVVAGGPGTGKTAIVVALVRALARLGLDVALAAPTGKAAARITDSVTRDLAAIADPDDHDHGLAAAPPQAQTLHRLLGWRPDGEFRHSELAPLPHAAVIVDEASMIDLALMERLVRAVRPDARLILLGDAHQLPSVDAGAVLADLVGLARGAGAAWAIELTESHRMRADDPSGRAVLEAARAIDAGQARRLIDGPDRVAVRRIGVADSRGEGVELVRIETLDQLDAALDAWWRGYDRDPRFRTLSAHAYRRRGEAWDPSAEAALGELLAIHEQRRLLTVTRGLATGAVAVNDRLHRRMLEVSTAERAPEFLPGEPVLITGNDYERRLYNGDQGVVVRVVDDDGAQRWRAVFWRAGELVPLPIDAVRANLELAWATTVHKSQGSELDQIALVLPHADLPLLTRELIYTALTRARRGALVLGTWAVLERGAARSAARHSGLARRIREHR
jgi:exodeoxyribonuclease V alpha subunit